jgi:hypothetical protein
MPGTTEQIVFVTRHSLERGCSERDKSTKHELNIEDYSKEMRQRGTGASMAVMPNNRTSRLENGAFDGI